MKNYIIEAGDTISAIAKNNGISQKKLLAANQSISDASDIKAGDQLSIPEKVEDPATQAANAESTSKTDGAVEECPLQAEWLTIKPLRYAVAEDDSEINLAEGLKLNADLPALTEHKYITRQLSDQVVYLYHPEEKYLLQVVYADGNGQGECLFGEPSQDVKAALPLLKQSKGSKVIMWLTQSPLTQARVDLLQANPDLIEKAGQKIDFAKAARDQQEDTFPLFDVKKYLAELTPNVTSLLEWSANPLETSTDENAFIGDYQSATPDNNYGVCLVDAIGITTDLCREFSIAYEMVMSNIATVQHPFQMAKLTRAVINREVKSVYKEVEESQKKRAQVAVGEFPSPEFTRAKIIAGVASIKDMPSYEEKKKEHEKEVQNYIEGYNGVHGNLAEKKAQEKKSELEEHIHAEEMDQFIADHPNAAKEQKKILEDLAEDWVSWLKDDKGSLDLALTWLDDGDEEQIPFKEALVAAMINNINAFDKGAELAKKWTDYIADQIEKGSDSNPVQTKGLGAHLMIAMGYVGQGLLIGSPWLNAFSGLVDGGRDAVAKYRKNLLESSKLTVTHSTELLFETATVHMVSIGVSSSRGQNLWQNTMETMAWRYGVQLSVQQADLSQVVPDITASYAAMIAVSGNKNLLEDTATEYSALRGKKVGLYNLEGEEPKKYPRYLAKYMNKIEVYAANSEGFKTAYANSDKLFTPARQTGAVGIFAAAQLYNTVSLYEAMEKATEQDGAKPYVDFFNAFYGVVTASIALVDKLGRESFAGTNFTAYMAGEGKDMGKGAIMLGNKVSAALKGSTKLKAFADILKFSAKEQMQYSELIGKGVTKVVGYSFRALPAVGAVFATVSSYLQLGKDRQAQNVTATTLSVLSLAANASSLVLFASAIIYTGPVLVPLAIALSILALGIDLVHGMFVDDAATVLIKRSFWGNGDYKYGSDLGTLKDRMDFFKALKQKGKKPEDTVIKAILTEQRAFCDYLFKPLAKITQSSKNDKGLSKFIIQVYLPGFIQWKSDVLFSITGRRGGTSVELATQSRDNRWQMNNLKGAFSMSDERTGLLTFAVDEALLAKHKIKKTGQMSRQNTLTRHDNNTNEQTGKGMNYTSYQMTLEYKYPSGFPVTLRYPNITIDDDKWSLSFWRDQTEIDDFHLEQSAL